MLLFVFIENTNHIPKLSQIKSFVGHELALNQISFGNGHVSFRNYDGGVGHPVWWTDGTIGPDESSSMEIYQKLSNNMCVIILR